MAISTIARSGNLCWSRNPIFYTLMYSGLTPGYGIQVQIMDSDFGTPIGEPLRFTISNATGFLRVNDLEKIIDPYLTWDYPLDAPAGTYHFMQVDDGMRRNSHLRYRQYSLALPNETWINDTGNSITVVKGGISDVSFFYEDTLNDTFNAFSFYPNPDGHAHPWISFRGLFGNVIHAKEWRYLLYHQKDVYPPVFVFDVTYTDNTTATFYNHVSHSAPFLNRFYRIAVGIEQQNLCPPGKKVLRYRVTARQFVLGPSTVHAFMDFEVDNRQVHDYMNLFYRTSVGGIETIFLTGVTNRNGASFSKKEFEGQRGIYVQRGGPNHHFHSEGRLKFTANTGYELGPKELMLLYDLYNNTDFCAARYMPPFQTKAKWMAVKVPEQEMPPINSDSFITSFKIDFESAGAFRNFPRNLMYNLKG